MILFINYKDTIRLQVLIVSLYKEPACIIELLSWIIL